MDRIATSWEGRFSGAAEKAFEHDKREVLALVGEAKAKSKARKATVNYEELLYDIDTYLRTNGNEYWRELFTPLIQGVVAEQGQEWASVLGMQFDVRNLEGEAWFQEYVLQFAQPINQTTSDGVHSVIAQGMEEGWAIPTMQEHLEQLFTQWQTGATGDEWDWFEQRKPPRRTELIARVETMHASNAGSYNLMRQWNVTYKAWLATLDGRERDTHRAATFQYDVGGVPGVIPMGQAFMVGGYPMQYPLDGSMGAPMSEIANCRCTTLPYNELPTVSSPDVPRALGGDDAITNPYSAQYGSEYHWTGTPGERYLQKEPTALDKEAQAWKRNLTEEQLDAMSAWSTNQNEVMARNIRNGEIGDREKAFLDAINQAPTVSQTIWRGQGTKATFDENLDFWKKQIGLQYEIARHVSTSLDPFTSSNFTSSNGYVLEIRSKRGRYINPAHAWYQTEDDEYEALLPPSKLRVVSVEVVDITKDMGDEEDMLRHKRILVICEDITDEQ